MILFSFMSVRLAKRIKDQDQSNVIWTYLLWMCLAFAAFAVSRSIGHIAKRILLTVGLDAHWKTLQPYSGAINTLTFALVASITLFFERIWKVYQQVLGDKLALQDAHEKLLYMNRNLENLIEERTHELTVSERKHRRIFELSLDMIAVVNGNGEIVDLNPAGKNMLGISHLRDLPERILFKDFFVHPENWNSLRDTLHVRGFIADTEILLKRHNGTHFSALVGATSDWRPNGNESTIHFLVKDISQRKAIENQLLQADKLASIGQLAAGIAHEINNPLSMILGYTQLLIRDEQEGTQRHADLRIIEKHTRTCKIIVEDLLNFARSTRTKKAIAHIHTAIESILSVVQHHLELDGIKIEKDFDMRVPPMVLDGEKIKQVLMNLIMNAKQAIGKKGSIRVMTRYDEHRNTVTIQVTDSGAGIEPQHITRIFDPFFTTKATGEGTGLGLSVSYGIVKEHGGEIMVDSAMGEGSTFTVILPVTSEGAGKKL
jgi:PAS domain S-box-containing protein